MNICELALVFFTQKFEKVFFIDSDETTAVNHSGLVTQAVPSDCDTYNWRRPRSESSADAESGKKYIWRLVCFCF